MTMLRAPRPAADASRPLPRAARAPVELFVVTHDDEFAAALREAAPATPLRVAATPGELADLLMVGRPAALVLDLATLGPAAATVARHLATQFPELPLVAVGSRDDEARLASLISTGQVYRFLHRPLSAARVRTFVDAALRRATELVPAMRPASPSRGRGGPSPWLLAALGAAIAVVIGVWLARHAGRSRPPAPRPAASQPASVTGGEPSSDRADAPAYLASGTTAGIATRTTAPSPAAIPVSGSAALAPRPSDPPPTDPVPAARAPEPEPVARAAPTTEPVNPPADAPVEGAPAALAPAAAEPAAATATDRVPTEAASDPAAVAAPEATAPEAAPAASASAPAGEPPAPAPAPTTMADAAPRTGEPRP